MTPNLLGLPDCVTWSEGSVSQGTNQKVWFAVRRGVGCDASLVGPPGASALDGLDVPCSVVLTLCMQDCRAGRHGGVGG